MLGNRSLIRLVLGAVVFAMVLFAMLAAPGLLSDRDSVVPVGETQLEAGR